MKTGILSFVAAGLFMVACQKTVYLRPNELERYRLAVSIQLLKGHDAFATVSVPHKRPNVMDLFDDTPSCPTSFCPTRIFGTFTNNSSDTYNTVWLIFYLNDNENAVLRKEWIRLDSVSPSEKRRVDYHLENDPSVENAELRAKAPFSATASYTYVHSRQFEFGGRVDTPLTPRQSFGLVGMWEKEKAGRIGIESYYTGHQRLEENPYRTESKAYVLFGVLAEHTFGPFRLFVNVENLTDVRQTRWNPLLRPDRGIDGRWTVNAWAPLDGRVLNGGIRLKF